MQRDSYYQMYNYGAAVQDSNISGAQVVAQPVMAQPAMA